MKWKKYSRAANAASVVVAVVLALTSSGWPRTRSKTLYEFQGGVDGIPQAGVIFDQAGNLYGTTTWGGTDSCGSVYELTPRSEGRWAKTVLLNFTCANGDYPAANLTFDQAGNLYGTTIIGGTYGGGTVFELEPNGEGAWTYTAVYNFTGGQDGYEPFFTTLVFDTGGNLYGTTYRGGNGNGVVFEMIPNPDGTWAESVLHTFSGADGSESRAGLIFDSAGNLYGTTQLGGSHGQGTVFELAHNPDGSWTESVLHSFTGGDDGAQPYGGLILDQAGNLYGTTFQGGSRTWGNVFELVLNPGGTWTEKVLHQFTGSKDGGNPQDSLVFDAAGNLIGTTCAGGSDGDGVVFKLSPNSGGEWKETLLQTFTDHPGSYAIANVTLDASGNIYGTTEGDGTKTFGSVFEIIP